MAVTICYENDCDPNVIRGKKVAVLGYGSQPRRPASRSCPWTRPSKRPMSS